jgi:hypothetical protein
MAIAPPFRRNRIWEMQNTAVAMLDNEGASASSLPSKNIRNTFRNMKWNLRYGIVIKAFMAFERHVKALKNSHPLGCKESLFKPFETPR